MPRRKKKKKEDKLHVDVSRIIIIIIMFQVFICQDTLGMNFNHRADALGSSVLNVFFHKRLRKKENKMSRE